MPSAILTDPARALQGIPYSVQATNGQDSDVSTSDTIKRMIEVVHSNANLPVVQETANQILLSSGDSTQDKLTHIYNWVKARMKFRTDEDILAKQLGLDEDKELLFTPHFILTRNWNYGDCDDYSTLLATLIVAAKVPVDVYFVTICADTEEPNRWSHVYVAVELCCGKLVPLDASHGPYVGWETKKALKKKYWLVSKGKEEGNMSILGMGDVSTGDWAGEAGTPTDTSGILGSSSSGIDWGSIVSSSINNGFGLARMIISQPKPGQFIQTGPGGTVNYQMPAGYTGPIPVTGFNVGTTGGGSTLLLLGGAALLLVMMMGKS